MFASRFWKHAVAKRTLGLLATAALITSCAHPLEVKNMGLYKPTFINNATTGKKIGLSTGTIKPDEERFVIAIANSLKRDGFKVEYPFYPQEDNLQSIDYLIRLTTSSQYKGSGWNFLINWPGFLIWTPAWHGYKYKVLYGFDADITDTRANESLPRISTPVELNLRHADMGRTWTELSWLEWSAIAFIGGIVFTRYDHDVTPLLLDHAEYKVGDYVASKIASSLASAEITLIWRRSPHLLASLAVE